MSLKLKGERKLPIRKGGKNGDGEIKEISRLGSSFWLSPVEVTLLGLVKLTPRQPTPWYLDREKEKSLLCHLPASGWEGTFPWI